MATVSRTGFGKSASVDAHYLYFGTYFGENKPHPHKNKNGVKVRNHGISTINCRKGYKNTCHDFKYWLRQNPRLKKHSINLSLNFGKDLNFSNPHDVNIGIRLTRRWLRKCFGKHFIGLVVAQDDNKNKESHCQACVLNIDTKTLKKMPSSKYNLTRLRRYNDAIMNAYNARNALQAGNRLQPLIHIQWGANHRKHHTKDKYVIKLADILWKVAKNPKITKRSRFKKILKQKYHIRFKTFRPGKRHKHYGISVGYNGKPSVKASQLRKVHKYISYFGLKKQFKLNKQHERNVKREHRKRIRTRSMATNKAFNSYSVEVSLYYTSSNHAKFERQYFSEDTSSAENRFGMSADDVINSAKSSSSASKVCSTTSSAKSIMAYVNAMKKNPFGSNEFFNSSTVSSAEDQIIFHPIPSNASESSSASTSSSATSTSSSDNSIASANESAFNEASSASAKAKRERKNKYEKENKRARINQEAEDFNQQTKRYHRGSIRYYRQIPQADQDIDTASKTIKFGRKAISWFHAKVSHAIDYFINKAKAKFKELVKSHKKHEHQKNSQKDLGGLD